MVNKIIRVALLPLFVQQLQAQTKAGERTPIGQPLNFPTESAKPTLVLLTTA